MDLSPHIFFFPVAGGSHIQDQFLRELLLLQLAGQTFFAKDHNTVRHTKQFLHFRGNHDDALAFLAHVVHQLVDLILRTDVNAAGGLVKDNDIRLGSHCLTNDDLLLVTTGEGHDLGILQVGSLDPHGLAVVIGDFCFFFGVYDAALGDTAQNVVNQVPGDGLAQEAAFTLSVLGDEADTVGVHGILGGFDLGQLAVDVYLAPLLGLGTEQDLHDLGTASADQTGDTQHFTAMGLEGDVLNTVTGEILQTLSATKNAVLDDYGARDTVTYVVSLVNTGTTALTGLTVTDDLGGYEFEGETLYPLTYNEGSIRYYVNGVLQTAPTVTAGPPLVIAGISVPANGNAIVIYETDITNNAPLEAGSTIINTATVTGGGLTAPITAEATINTQDRAELTVTKSVSPAVVSENGQLTYTFVIQNTGNTPATVDDAVVLTDIFDPILDPISVTFEGSAWAVGTNYTYDTATGTFSTLPGQITVPAATYTQNTDGTFTITPGTVTLVITGTV